MIVTTTTHVERERGTCAGSRPKSVAGKPRAGASRSCRPSYGSKTRSTRVWERSWRRSPSCLSSQWPLPSRGGVGLLYTVQVSFREQALVPEPFLIVGLIAAIRRLLVLTAEFARFLEKGGGAFQGAMVELGLLTVMIVALVGSLVSLRRRLSHAVADRAGAIETPEASV